MLLYFFYIFYKKSPHIPSTVWWVLLLCLGLAPTAVAQYTPTASWSMETVEQIKPLLRPLDSTPTLVADAFGQALQLDGKTQSLDFSNYLQMNAALSLSFWFKPQAWMGEQGVFRQSRLSKTESSQVGRFIEVQLKENTAEIKTEKTVRIAESDAN